MLVQHNVPPAVADELTPPFRDVFPDSKVAQNFSSRWTKTACMINGAIAPSITVRLFDQECGVVRTHFLDMCLLSLRALKESFQEWMKLSPSTISGGKAALAWVLTIPLWTWDAGTLLKLEFCRKIPLCIWWGALVISSIIQQKRLEWLLQSKYCDYTAKLNALAIIVINFKRYLDFRLKNYSLTYFSGSTRAPRERPAL